MDLDSPRVRGVSVFSGLIRFAGNLPKYAIFAAAEKRWKTRKGPQGRFSCALTPTFNINQSAIAKRRCFVGQTDAVLLKRSECFLQPAFAPLRPLTAGLHGVSVIAFSNPYSLILSANVEGANPRSRAHWASVLVLPSNSSSISVLDGMAGIPSNENSS